MDLLLLLPLKICPKVFQEDTPGRMSEIFKQKITNYKLKTKIENIPSEIFKKKNKSLEKSWSDS